MNSNLHTIEDTLMTYLFCFVHLIILRNSKTTEILNIETDSPVRKDGIIPCLFRHFNYQNQQWFQNICVSQTQIYWIIFKFQQFHFQRIKLVSFSLYYFGFQLFRIFQDFIQSMSFLKEILKKNTFLFKLTDNCCIKNFLNKILTEKPVTLTAKKKDLVIVLSFLGKLSLDLRTCLKNSISKNLPFCKIFNMYLQFFPVQK